MKCCLYCGQPDQRIQQCSRHTQNHPSSSGNLYHRSFPVSPFQSFTSSAFTLPVVLQYSACPLFSQPMIHSAGNFINQKIVKQCEAPSVFQCLINDVLGDMLGQFIIAYIDDILIFFNIIGKSCQPCSPNPPSPSSTSTLH